MRDSEWKRGKMYSVGQAFQPDVRLESLTYTCAIPSAGPLRPITARSASSVAVLAMILAAPLWAVARGNDVSGPVTGEVRLASGRTVSYTIHFRPELAARQCPLRRWPHCAHIVRRSLRFELPAIRLVRERMGSEEISCIGRGEGETILAGLSDGRVCRVDPVTLDLTDMAKLPSAPDWVGWKPVLDKQPAGLIAATKQTKTVDRDGHRWRQPVSVVHDLTTGTTHLLDWRLTTFLLDRAGRLWLGADSGEFGGWVARIDLANWKVVEIKPPPDLAPDPDIGEVGWEGVYGFIERHEGQILAFGGTSHLGLNSGFITRIDQAEPHRLFAFDPPKDEAKPPDPGLPSLPITHVVEEDNGLFVLSYSDVFRVDSDFKGLEKGSDTPDCVSLGSAGRHGGLPVCAPVHPPRRDGEGYVFATVRNGYVSLEGATTTTHGTPGQLGGRSGRCSRHLGGNLPLRGR